MGKCYFCENSVFIGINAGLDITEGDGIVIIGDNIKNLDRTQEDVVFIGKKVAIGKTIFGKECNLLEILKEYVQNLPKGEVISTEQESGEE